MENNFDNRDFEQYVKTNADQYRMFPSEKVWKNIHYTLHTRRRWYGLGLGLLLITAGMVTWVMLNPSLKNNRSLSDKPATSAGKATSEQIKTEIPVLIATVNPAHNNPKLIANDNKSKVNLFYTGTAILPDVFDDGDNNPVQAVPALKIEPVIASPVPTPVMPSLAINQQTIPEGSSAKAVNNEEKANRSLPAENKQEVLNQPSGNAEPAREDLYPLSIESVVNSYKHERHGKKLKWELFITPSVSYRKLSENKAFINSALANNNVYNYSSYTDINRLVTHRPDMGLQAGLTAGYPLTKSLKLIGGFQFNVSKYDIRASFSSGEVATIALNTGSGSNSVSTISNYRNSSSTKADWLRNLYFSASVPFGAELKLSGNHKTQIGIAGSIQPTFILSDRAYLLSTDYKNYAEVPSLIRRWNMNTSFEIFAGYSTGKVDWRIGPQVRYQLKSSFKSIYPVNEHLFDFGLKVGMMLNK